MTFSEIAKKHAPWSMSKAELALHCGLSYNLKYVSKAQGTPPKDGAGRVGIAAHAVIEGMLKSPGKPLKDVFMGVSVARKLTTIEMDELVSFGHSIQHFNDRLTAYKERNRVKKQQVELKFGLTEDMRLTQFFAKDVFFRGAMDLIMSTEDNSVVILDHKSGTPPANQAEALEQHRDQLKLYAMTAKVMYPELVGVQSGLHYLANEEIVWDTKVVTPEMIRDEIEPWYQDFLNRAGQAGENPTPHVTWKCKFCEFVEQCPLKKQN